jgi:hypothetical protein
MVLKNDNLYFYSKEKDYRINLNFTEISVCLHWNHLGDENLLIPVFSAGYANVFDDEKKKSLGVGIS